MKRICLFLIVTMMIGILPTALANPVWVATEDPGLPLQDDWVIPEWTEYEELGIGFPPDELISVQEIPWLGHKPCPTDFTGLGAMVQLEITNLTGEDKWGLIYVADPETSLSNVDELVADQNAPLIYTHSFAIDWGGFNTPLVYESMTQDGIFEAGETWEFIIQDYNNSLNLPASMIDSLGVAGASQGGSPSSGSIIAIPEPNVIVMILMSGGGLFFFRRKF